MSAVLVSMTGSQGLYTVPKILSVPLYALCVHVPNETRRGGLDPSELELQVVYGLFDVGAGNQTQSGRGASASND